MTCKKKRKNNWKMSIIKILKNNLKEDKIYWMKDKELERLMNRENVKKKLESKDYN